MEEQIKLLVKMNQILTVQNERLAAQNEHLTALLENSVNLFIQTDCNLTSCPSGQ